MLTTVALSASDVLPILPDRNTVQVFNIDDQSDNNIYSNSYQDSDLPNSIFYNNAAAGDRYVSPPNFRDDNLSMNNDNYNLDEGDLNENYVKEDNYDDKRYRKEQWHNYPRQLDRLQNSKHTRDETDEVAIPKPSFSKPIDGHFDDYSTNEFRVESTDGDRNVYENVVAATNPFLVLKVQLMYLRDDADGEDSNQYPNLYLLQSETDQSKNVQDNNNYMKDIESKSNLVKVKREEPTNDDDNEIADERSFITEIGKECMTYMCACFILHLLYCLFLSLICGDRDILL